MFLAGFLIIADIVISQNLTICWLYDFHLTGLLRSQSRVMYRTYTNPSYDFLHITLGPLLAPKNTRIAHDSSVLN